MSSRLLSSLQRCSARSATVLIATVTVLTTGAAAASARPSAPTPSTAPVLTIDHRTPPLGDPQFNQALGINDRHVIVGYAGDPGTDGKPNKGWVVTPPYAQGNFSNENVPGSQQTQVVGINNTGQTVGFWVDKAGNNVGFLKRGNLFTTIPGVTQLLGINSKGAAVGFSTAPNGSARPVRCTFTRSSLPACSAITLPGNPTNATATGINDHGDIAGFIVHGGRSSGFVLAAGGTFWQPAGLGDNKGTAIFGINNADLVVGSYTAGTATHAFVATAFTGRHQTVDNPAGVGASVLNGVNNLNQAVGFYTDVDGATHGYLIG